MSRPDSRTRQNSHRRCSLDGDRRARRPAARRLARSRCARRLRARGARSRCSAERAGRRPGRGRRRPAIEEIPGGADPADARVIDEWSKALTRGDVAAAARLFAIPSVAQNGPALIRIRDAADARLFNSSLPCGARLVEATPEGGFVVATFELSERPGGDCGSGAGGSARTAFEIVDGEIVEWRRVATGDGPRRREPGVGELDREPPPAPFRVALAAPILIVMRFGESVGLSDLLSREECSCQGSSWSCSPLWCLACRSDSSPVAMTTTKVSGSTGGGGETSLDMVIGVSLPLSGDLADFGPPGEKAADLALDRDQRRDRGGRRRPHGRARQRGQLRRGRSAVRGAGAAQAGDVRRRELHRRRLGLGRHDPERRVGVDPRGGPADLAGGDQRRDHRSRRRRLRQPDLTARLVPGPDPGELHGSRSSAAPRARRSTSAPATTPTAPASRRRSAPRGRSSEATIGEEVIYDLDLPNYDTEAEQITSGNPDAIVIIDFPETYNKVGPALVRTGNFDPSTTFVTDGLISSDLARAPGRRRSTACAAPRRACPTTRRRRRRSTSAYKAARAEGRRAADVRRSELRRRGPLLPGSGRRRVDRGRRHGRARSRRSAAPG